ncbi:unnamed protein product, partial [Meganyctiphanes norvegica]
SDHLQSSQTRVSNSRMRSSAPAINKGSSLVSLSHRGLTVSIRNNIASSRTRLNGAGERRRPRLNRNRLNSSPAIFTVVNDHRLPAQEGYDYDDNNYENYSDSDVATEQLSYSGTKRNFILQQRQQFRQERSVDKYIIPAVTENYRVMPEPHRQTLDPKVQKEIAMLQGKDQVNLNNGPGPGVKNFRHVPNHTLRTLHQRFTQDPIPPRVITI